MSTHKELWDSLDFNRRRFLFKKDINILWRRDLKIPNVAWMKQSTIRMSTDSQIAMKCLKYSWTICVQHVKIICNSASENVYVVIYWLFYQYSKGNFQEKRLSADSTDTEE